MKLKVEKWRQIEFITGLEEKWKVLKRKLSILCFLNLYMNTGSNEHKYMLAFYVFIKFLNKIYNKMSN